jgi:FMN phosphatase YigB (HAD superfamily)
MSKVESLKASVKIYMFDQYGTVVDMHSGLANHAFDCIGAKSAGMRTAFIDRRQRPFGITPHQPDILVRTMAELADVMACSGPPRRGASP